MTPPPLLPLEHALDKLATALLQREQKVRVITTENLFTIVKYHLAYLPKRDYYSHEKERCKETFSERCWKCGSLLVPTKAGWYCPRCQRYRRVKLSVLQWKRRGGGQEREG